MWKPSYPWATTPMMCQTARHGWESVKTAPTLGLQHRWCARHGWEAVKTAHTLGLQHRWCARHGWEAVKTLLPLGYKTDDVPDMGEKGENIISSFILGHSCLLHSCWLYSCRLHSCRLHSWLLCCSRFHRLIRRMRRRGIFPALWTCFLKYKAIALKMLNLLYYLLFKLVSVGTGVLLWQQMKAI